MKKILFVLALLSNALFLSAQIDFQGGYYENALAKAQEEDKLIFIDAYTDWCGPCKWMSRNVFSNYRVGNYYNDNFVNLKIDMESNLGRRLAREYNVNSYPTFLFVTGDGDLVHRSIGSCDASDFITTGKRATRKAERLSYRD